MSPTWRLNWRVFFASLSIWLFAIAMIKIASPAPDYSTSLPGNCPLDSQNCAGFGIWGHRTNHPEPVPYPGSIEDAISTAMDWATKLDRATILHSNDTNIHVVDTSLLLRFDDDVFIHVECLDGTTLVHARSSSRIGVSDLNVNPNRLDTLVAHLESTKSDSSGC
ncbi:MAG: DUF1499 domain-containing protein [Euryarchaeota archaeon]|jgi:uncharacterized protein (DUF1499 family)|nr:DUF1499 domain-containing protein [Euryarchaeota archaeon]